MKQSLQDIDTRCNKFIFNIPYSPPIPRKRQQLGEDFENSLKAMKKQVEELKSLGFGTVAREFKKYVSSIRMTRIKILEKRIVILKKLNAESGHNGSGNSVQRGRSKK